MRKHLFRAHTKERTHRRKRLALLLLFTCICCRVALSQCTNVDFESTPLGTYTTANAVSGWTISSQQHTSCSISNTWNPGSSEFSIIQTPILNVPGIGTLPNSPFGGWQVAKLNNTAANSQLTRITRQLTVTANNAVFGFAYAGMWEIGNHSCCEQSFLRVHVRDNLGNLLQCPSYTPAAPGCSGVQTNTITSGLSWTNWQVQYINLNLYIGTSVTVEIMTADCIYNDHYGTVYLDAICPQQSTTGLYGMATYTTMNFCGTGSVATLAAPSGYSTYSWTAPIAYPLAAGQNTLSSITITNAVLGSTYTLSVLPGCTPPILMTLTTTAVSIVGLGASNSCQGGASGSATVMAQGSATGYSYMWTNSLSAMVGTNQSVMNLPAGAYTITVAVPGNQSCGSSSGTVSVGSNSLTFSNQLKPYCGAEAYLTAPAGSNFQWYSGTVAIPSGQGGTAQNYTVTNAVASAVYRLIYTSAQGCQDSIHYVLSPVSAQGSVAVSNPLLCQGGSNGSSIITLTPSPGSPPGTNYFSIISSGTTPAYSASLMTGSSNSFVATGLAAGTYSIRVFDGLCTYNRTLNVSPYIFNYSISPASATICPGNAVAAMITFSAAPSAGQYTYSWSPINFIAGNANTFSSTIITPTVPLGSQATLTYTTVVTPTAINCPVMKTMTLLVVNPFPPAFPAIPALCNNHGSFTITGSPPGGVFNGNPGATSAGLNTFLCPVGTNSLSYIYYTSGCGVALTRTFQILPIPLLAVTGATDLCQGQSTTTLTAQGATTYTWSTGSSTFSTVINAVTAGTYTLSGALSNACVSSKTVALTVTPIPTLSIFGTSFCAGNTATVVASGASTYSWSTGNTNSVVLIPSTTPVILTVKGSNSPACYASRTILLLAYPKPTIEISGRVQLCKGESTFLFANGAASYTWLPYSTNPVLSLSPSASTVISVTGSSTAGCVSSKSITVLVDNCTDTPLRTAKDQIDIYPNPGIQINLSAPFVAHCLLYNLDGKLLLEFNHLPPVSVLDLSSYQEGMYILSVQTEEKIIYHKLIRKN